MTNGSLKIQIILDRSEKFLRKKLAILKKGMHNTVLTRR